LTFAHRAEAAAAAAALALFKALPPAAASNLAGAIARTIGPFIGASRTADRNLAAAFPDLTAAQRRAIIVQVWDTMGRNAGELPHLASLHETASGPGFQVTGWDENWAPALATPGPSLVMTAHYGNWEAVPRVIRGRGINTGFIYRAASNNLVDDMIQSLRRRINGADVPMFAKGAAGARGAYAHLKQNGQLAMLVDQKLDAGLPVPFFGRPAMTPPAMATFALKFRCPILPMRALRRGPARIELICEPPLPLPDTGDRQADIASLTLGANQLLERWITEQPGSWLWLHRRWPKHANPYGDPGEGGVGPGGSRPRGGGRS
jgi:KDO2-lipid IV(A) lauroyltransferase